MRRTSVSRKIFVLVNTIFLVAVALLCLLPLVNLFALSLSGKSAANSGIVTFWPVDFTLLAYEKTFQNNNFIRSILISFLRTGIGTVLSMCVITTAGYALSKDFKGRTPLMWFFVFTMLFSGGLIPSYLVNSTLGLKNNFLIYVLPGAFSCYNLILIMNFFRSIPKSLEEAALIDGAGFFTVLRKIYLPLSKAGLATVALFIMVGNWNEWFTGILYMSDTKNYPLVFLPAGYCCTGKPTGFGTGSHFGGSHVGTYHKGGTGIYRGTSHIDGVSVPSEIFCEGYCYGGS